MPVRFRWMPVKVALPAVAVTGVASLVSVEPPGFVPMASAMERVESGPVVTVFPCWSWTWTVTDWTWSAVRVTGCAENASCVATP